MHRTKRGVTGFTLIELLIVIGILAVLATATALILNPAELLAQARDGKRISDLDNLDKYLGIHQTQGGDFTSAESDKVYISLPAPNSDCTGAVPAYSLPLLPSGWEYRCADAANFRNADGTGWLPINLAGTAGLSLPSLPVDPVNSDVGQKYYTFIKGSWSLTAQLESTKYTQSIDDNGVDNSRYERGTDLSLWSKADGLVAYWPFNEEAGEQAADLSGGNNSANLLGSPIWGGMVDCKKEACIVFDGQDDYVSIPYKSSLALNQAFTVSLWLRLDSNPDVGASNEWRVLIRKQSGGTAPFFLYLEQSSVINLTVVKGGTQYRYIDNSFASELLSVGQWTHLAYTYDSTTGVGTAYKNGVVNRSGPMRNGAGGPAIPAGPLDSSTANWHVSNYPGVYPPSSGAGSIPGKIDELRLYNRALSAAEISEIYNAEN